MKQNQTRKEPSTTRQILKELVNRHKAASKIANRQVTIGPDPLPAPDLYQDSGGGYNVNLVYPQD